MGVAVGLYVLGGLGLGVVVGFPDGKDCQSKAQGDVGGSEQEGGRAEAVCGGQVAGNQCGHGDAQVAGRLVEAHGQAASFRTHEIHFHDDRGGPGEALTDAEQHVGRHDPGG